MSEVKDKLTEGLLATFKEIGQAAIEKLNEQPAPEPTEEVVEKDADDKEETPVEGITMEQFKDGMSEVVGSLKGYIDEKLKTKEDKVAEKKANVVDAMKGLLAEQGFDVDTHEIDINISEVKKGSNGTDSDGELRLKMNSDETEEETEEVVAGNIDDMDPELRKAASMEIWREKMFGNRK